MRGFIRPKERGEEEEERGRRGNERKEGIERKERKEGRGYIGTSVYDQRGGAGIQTVSAEFKVCHTQ